MSTKEERLKLWNKIKTIPEGEVEPSLIRELSIYKGQSGICRDKSGVTISLLHTGRHFPDDIFESGLLYHYPETDRRGAYDQNEIDSTKECHRLNIPLFVILPGKQVQKRTVKLGWVIDHDESLKLFLVEYGEELPATKEVCDDFIGREKRKLKTTSAKTRPNQAKFRFKVLQRYGAKCAVCNIENKFLLDASHIIQVENEGNDDPRNGLVLCKNHHKAFDRNLFFVNPENLNLEGNLSGLNISESKVVTKTKEFPHSKALRYRYKKVNMLNDI